MPRATWDALRAHVVRERKKKKRRESGIRASKAGPREQEEGGRCHLGRHQRANQKDRTQTRRTEKGKDNSIHNTQKGVERAKQGEAGGHHPVYLPPAIGEDGWGWSWRGRPWYWTRTIPQRGTPNPDHRTISG